MAGAADELLESIIINPNNKEEISDSIKLALEMQPEEQRARYTSMQERIKRYTINNWADDFLTSLNKIKSKQQRLRARIINDEIKQHIISDFETADSRLLFIDYDGTLIPVADRPEKAIPDERIVNLLRQLGEIENTKVVLISGRGRFFLDSWFGNLPVSIVAEHGLFLKEYPYEWKQLRSVNNNWMKKLKPIIEQFTTKLPGSFVEEKEHSLVFHYRLSETSRAAVRIREMINHLIDITANLDLQVELLKGNKVVEVHPAGIDKGLAAVHWLSEGSKQFILAVGDDHTDETLFKAMPDTAYTLKVGYSPSYATYNISGPDGVVELLTSMLKGHSAFHV